jgi:hypothetical protein
VSNMRRLHGRKIAVLAADGFEKVGRVPMCCLQPAVAKVDAISLRHGRLALGGEPPHGGHTERCGQDHQARRNPDGVRRPRTAGRSSIPTC